MTLKTFCLRAQEAYSILMVGIEFYQKHEEEIKMITGKIKTIAGSIKESLKNWWKIDSIESTEIANKRDYLETVDVDYKEVTKWISDKHVVSIEDVSKRFNLSSLESVLVLKQLESNDLVDAIYDRLGSYKVIYE